MKIFLIAGEMSGDRLGADLISALRELNPDIEFTGIGGHAMQAAGLKLVFSSAELSVMGIWEVLRVYPRLRSRLKETAEAIVEQNPDIVIGIDSPDFNQRVYKAIRSKISGKIVHYVAPTVWAWRPGRVFKYARLVDLMLALFPFEPPFWDKSGVPCKVVGHPIAQTHRYLADEITTFEQKHDLSARSRRVIILPGSRRSEVERHQDVMFELVPDLKAQGFEIVTVAADGMEDLISAPAGVKKLTGLSRSDRELLYQTASFAIAASGTVSLELAAARTPMVIGYTMSKLTWVIKKALVKLDTVTLVNILWGQNVVPECLGPDFTADNLRKELAQIIGNPEKQRVAFDHVLKEVGAGEVPAHEKAARAILDLP